jgi:HK97 family phage portal protein
MANFITRMFDSAVSRVAELRTSLENPQTPLSYPAEWLLDIFNGGRTDSGIRVSEMTALQVGTVFAAVNIISDGMSSLPLHVYQRSKIGNRSSKTIAVDSSLYQIINQEPNPEMTSAVFLKTLMVHDLLWGNAYAEIQRNNAGAIIAIWPRNPARTRPIRLLKPLLLEGDVLEPGTMLYETSDQLMDSSSYVVDQNPEHQQVGLKRLVLAENMIHVPGLSLDGRLGQSTVWLARQAFGLALATEKYGAKFFGNGARPAGILTLPNKLEDKAIDTLRRSWAEAHGGENQFKVAVLEQGVKYEKIAATPEEGQMLQTRRYEREEICAIFGVPAHMVCAQEKGGKSNVEQSSIEFVLYCLHPWLNRYEQEFGRKLFSKMGRSAGQYFAKFDTRKLMYPDAAARSTFYSQGKQWGFLNTNMILELEDMNPVEDEKVGETFWQPINMQDAGDPQKLGATDQNELDIKKAQAVAEHAAQMQQDTAKVTTNLQMKAAEQSHGHAMEASKESNKHVQTMTKLGHPPATPGVPGAPAASANQPAAADAAPADKKATKRFVEVSDVQAAMQEAYNDDFVFVTAINSAEGRSYRYANVDGRELVIVHAREQK